MLLCYVSGGVETFNVIIELKRLFYEGWFFQALHFMGAGIIFFGIFLHICRGLFYGSGIFPNMLL